MQFDNTILEESDKARIVMHHLSGNVIPEHQGTVDRAAAVIQSIVVIADTIYQLRCPVKTDLQKF
jgi:hypothetical protein